MPKVEIHISMDERGAVTIGGPFDNKVLMFGLLETGKQAYIDHLAHKGDRIVPATMVPPNLKLD